MPDENQEDYNKGYYLMPRQLRVAGRHAGINTIKLVEFIADETLGWDASRWARLTYPEILNGCKWHDGDGSGLPNDAAITRAIKEALALRLIEVRYVTAGTLYAIHRRFWRMAGLIPKWHLYKHVAYYAPDDPLEEETQPEQATITTIAQQLESPENAEKDHGSASTMIATNYQDDSKPLSPGLQAAITRLADESPEAAPDQGRQRSNKALEESSSNIVDEESVAPSLDATAPGHPEKEDQEAEKTENEHQGTISNASTAPSSEEVAQAKAAYEAEKKAKRAQSRLQALTMSIKAHGDTIGKEPEGSVAYEKAKTERAKLQRWLEVLNEQGLDALETLMIAERQAE